MEAYYDVSSGNGGSFGAEIWHSLFDLVKRGYFETTLIDRRIRIITSSFEAWYQKQTHYVKISERSNENGIYREA